MPVAVYDDKGIWGVGDSEPEARSDAKEFFEGFFEMFPDKARDVDELVAGLASKPVTPEAADVVHGQLMTPRAIPVREALRIIEANDLRPANGAWHYSWDIERFCDTMMLQQIDNALHVYAPLPLNEWAPVAHFTDAPDTVALRTSKPDAPMFWFLRLTSRDEFLKRRSELSRNPANSFPTLQTYPAAARKLGCRLEHIPLAQNEARFAAWYDALKPAKYNHAGDACWRGALAHNRGVPLDWFFVSALLDTKTGECKAVHLCVQDDRSCSSINGASELRNGPNHGTLLDIMEIERLCNSGRLSFDCGVSGAYGGYKRKVFIDAMPTVSIAQQISLLTRRG